MRKKRLPLLPPESSGEEAGEAYESSEEEMAFVSDVLAKLDQMYRLKQEPQTILGATLKDFWDQSILDYAVLQEELQDPDDPVRKYQSSVSRDKTFAVIANATTDLLYPDVIAQNEDQSIDRTIGRVASSLLRYAHKHDGWPNENGEQKNHRYAHTAAVEGTCHVLDIVTKEGLESEYIPNEEIYLPTFWQPNIQKMPRVYRVKFNVLYEEAEELFGHREAFRRVEKNSSWWARYEDQLPSLKDSFTGILQEDKVSIIYIWEKSIEYSKKGRPKVKMLYNAMVNDVLMFPPDHKLPYRHGFYPISKLIFEHSARADYYWGISVPYKCREDKQYKDELKTLLRFKGKQAALPPQTTTGADGVDDTMFLPSAITPVPVGFVMEPVKGVTGVQQSDVLLMQMTDQEIDRATVSPKLTGLPTEHRETATAIRAEAANSRTLLDPFKRQIGYFMQSRSFPVLEAMFQLFPKRDLAKIAIPDEKLSDGLTGTFEVLFESVDLLDEEQRLEKSFQMLQEQKQSRLRGEPKDMAYVSPSYVKNLKFFLFSDASGASGKDQMRRDRFERMLQYMLNSPDFDHKEVNREIVRINDFSERLLASGNVPGNMPISPEGNPLVDNLPKQQPATVPSL